MSTISENEFKRLCDDVYADRRSVYSFNPNVSRREAVLWMLAGCLVSLLDVPILEQPSVYDGTNADLYAGAIIELLQSRMKPSFDPQRYLAELSAKIAAE